MSRLFTFLQTYRSGIFLLVLLLASIAFLVQWLAWIFSLGRFRPSADPFRQQNFLRYTISEAIVKIVNEFGHVIALIILFIFSFTLIFALVQTRGDIAGMTDALKTVVSTMGGLVGAVIGYYFNRKQTDNERPPPSNEPVPLIMQAPTPPSPSREPPTEP